jgi:hypothetical protein
MWGGKYATSYAVAWGRVRTEVLAHPLFEGCAGKWEVALEGLDRRRHGLDWESYKAVAFLTDEHIQVGKHADSVLLASPQPNSWVSA